MTGLYWTLSVALAAAVLVLYVGYKWADTASLRTNPTEPAPEIPPTDPMVLCPTCGLLGYHSLDEIPPVSNPIRVIELPNGDTVELTVWAGGVPGHYRRECCFCHVEWTFPMTKEEAG